MIDHRRRPCWAGLVVIGVCLSASAAPAWAGYIVPIAAHSPQVVVGLTTERDPIDANFEVTNDTTLNPALAMPSAGSPGYVIATWDTGAGVHLFSRDAYNTLGIGTAGKDGAFPTLVNGVAAIASDPLGVYAGGFGAITATSPLAADASQLVGQYNASVLYAPPGESLPSVIGTPLSSQYTSRFDYANAQIIDIGGTEFRSPQVVIEPFGTTPNPTRRLQINVATGLLGDPPAFFPSLLNFDHFGDDPAAPTVGPSFFMAGNVSDDGNAQNGLDMILDTGSQGTFVSEQVAATLGFDVINDTPDFVVGLQTVSGSVQDVPGFYADQLTLPGTDGGLTLTDVPLIVFNLPDPRSSGNILDGLLGMNLFADRVVTLDPEPAALDSRDWDTAAASASFNDAASWTGAGGPAIDWIAHVENNAGIDQTAVIGTDATINALNIVGDTEAMAVQINNGATLTVLGTAIITPNGELRMNGGSITTLGVEVRGGAIAGSGTIGGEVLVKGTLAPGQSAGVLQFTGNVDLLDGATTQIEIGGTDNAGPPQFDQVLIDGAGSLSGALDLSLLGGYTPVTGDTADIVIAAGGLNGTFDQITGVVLDPATGLAVTYAGDRVTVTVARLGDANLDGSVDALDLDRLRLAWLADGQGWATGDLNGDGTVDAADLQYLADNWDAGPLSAQQVSALAASFNVVPEPTTLPVVLGGLVLLVRRRKRPAFFASA